MKKTKLTLILLTLATLAGAQTSFYVPGGSSGILSSPNGNLGIGMAPLSHTTLAISSGSLAPLDMRTDQTVFKFGGHIFSLNAKPTFANVPYIEWRTADGTRQAYLGWRSEVFALKLENNFNFLIDGGKVGIGIPTPSATLEIRSDVVSVPNTETSIINVQSRPATGMTDNLFQLNQAVGDQSSTTYAILRMGNQFNNGAVPNQIVLNTNGNSWLNGGRVGIGTTSPVGILEIFANSTGGDQLHIANANPGGRSTVVLKQGSTAKAFFQYRGTTSTPFANTVRLMTQSGTNADIILGANGGHHLFIAGGQNGNAMGRIGIGTTTPDEKLTVKGKIHAEEVRIDLSVPAPDYVFEKDYPLPSLEEVKKFIDEHKHLPEVPSAKEMEEHGVNVGEMNMILLKKVEELTLYVIEQNRLIAQIEEERDASTNAAAKKMEDLILYVIELKTKVEALQKGNSGQ